MSETTIASRRAHLSAAAQTRLAKRIRGEIASKASAAKIPRRADRSVAPLSFAQEGQWLLDQLHPGNSVFSVYQVFRVPDRLDKDVLERSLSDVVRRHDILRTNFRMIGRSLVQVIRPAAPVSVEWVEAAHLCLGPGDGGFARWIKERTSRPFDVGAGDLLRVHVLQIAEDDAIVVLNLHHIICDGWSLGILIGEVLGGYRALSCGKELSRPELPLQYGDYAAWQRARLQQPVIERQLEFWRRRLAGAPAVTPLPTDRARPAERTFQGSRRSIYLRTKLVTRLRMLCQRRQATLFMVLLSALATLLHRYSGAEDIVIGCPVANRGFPELEPLIGLFINTLAFRLDLSGDPSFEALLGRARAEAMEVYGNQDVPFESIVKELGIRREKSHAPVFQVMLAMQPPRVASIFSALDVEPALLSPDRAKFDLMLLLTEFDDGKVNGTLEFPTDLFDGETIDRLIGHFLTLLEGIAEDAVRPLSELPMLSESERVAAAEASNGTRPDAPHDRCIHELFAEQVARTPDAVAVTAVAGELTYAKLERRANQLAHHLRHLGVGPDVIVGLAVESSLELVIGLLGILKAGGAYLPLDPCYPRDRLAYMLQDAGAPVLVTQAALTARLPEHGGVTVNLDADWPEIASRPGSLPVSGTAPGNLAYVLYTSGSTGRPKGVMGTHAAVVNRLNWDVPSAPSPEIYAQKTTPNFIDVLWEIFMPLIRGQSLAIVPTATVLEAEKLVDHLARHGVTRIVLVPSLLRAILDRIKDNLSARLPRLGYWACSGEPLPEQLASTFRKRLPHARLFNIYGTSEFWDATWCEVADGTNLSAVPIGRPIAHMRALVLDQNLALLPANAIGELFVGGAGLARGYLRRPALTAERFVPDPFGVGGRLYRAGDLARRRSDGTLEFVGRCDRQIKIRGRRIEPGEIEAALTAHPDVAQAVVLARADAGETSVVGYLVAANGAAPEISELRAHLRQLLPEYMVPAAFVVLPALPLTPNGKVDRLSLPAPAAPASRAEFVPAGSAAEDLLVAMWREILKIDRVGINDNFFDLGGDSLMLVKLQGMLAERLRQDVAITMLFQFPTVRALATHLDTNPRLESAVHRSNRRGEARKQARLQRSRATNEANAVVVGK